MCRCHIQATRQLRACVEIPLLLANSLVDALQIRCRVLVAALGIVTVVVRLHRTIKYLQQVSPFPLVRFPFSSSLCLLLDEAQFGSSLSVDSLSMFSTFTTCCSQNPSCSSTSHLRGSKVFFYKVP